MSLKWHPFYVCPKIPSIQSNVTVKGLNPISHQVKFVLGIQEVQHLK
jgi:hypothetical protein